MNPCKRVKMTSPRTEEQLCISQLDVLCSNSYTVGYKPNQHIEMETNSGFCSFWTDSYSCSKPRHNTVKSMSSISSAVTTLLTFILCVEYSGIPDETPTLFGDYFLLWLTHSLPVLITPFAVFLITALNLKQNHTEASEEQTYNCHILVDRFLQRQ